MKIVVSGATGMVGRAVVERLAADGNHDVIAVTRRGGSVFPQDVRVCSVGDITGQPDWSAALQGADVVIHTAARVHQMREEGDDFLQAFREVNNEATQNLAKKAAATGVRRFVFISSIKVNGEATFPGKPFAADDSPAPEDGYALSKLEAELGLRHISAQTGMEYVILRLPLVYGPGVRANFLSMMRWLYWRVPLPLGSIDNRRSLLGLDNLVDLLCVCIDHPAAANQIFLASDNDDLSTAKLLRRMGGALGRRSVLLPFPVCILRVGAKLVGRSDIVDRLCDSLQVDLGKTQALLHWSPPVSVDEGLRRTAAAFLRGHR